MRALINDFVFQIRCFVVAVIITCSMVASLLASESTRPNIVVILADDMGYGDVQALNPSSNINTPNLNRLAEQGMTFTDAHTPSAVCTPTRYGLLTGRYCWRTRLKRGVLNGYGTPLVDADRLTIAGFLQNAGYHTGIVGKWHLGLGFIRPDGKDDIDFAQPVTDGPHTHGFDSSFVIPASLDFPPYVFIQDGKVTALPKSTQPAQSFPRFLRNGELGGDFDMEKCLDRLTDEAVGFIEKLSKTKEPFFLYFPLTAPHKPVWPHERFRGTTELGPYGDFVTQVDATVGRVLESLDVLKLTENTLVIYTSDNGSYMYRRDDPTEKDHVDDETIQAFRADRHTSNGPLRGTKADVWDGGHRVPFFVRWPGHVEAGSRCKTPVCLTDVFATCAEVIGQNVPEHAAPDSDSFLAQLKGAQNSTRRPVIHHSANGVFAIRDGDWKLVLGSGSGGREAPKGKPFEQPYSLFNMATDIGEQHNVLEEHPDIAARLEKACLDIRDNEGRK